MTKELERIIPICIIHFTGRVTNTGSIGEAKNSIPLSLQSKTTVMHCHHVKSSKVWEFRAEELPWTLMTSTALSGGCGEAQQNERNCSLSHCTPSSQAFFRSCSQQLEVWVLTAFSTHRLSVMSNKAVKPISLFSSSSCPDWLFLSLVVI